MDHNNPPTSSNPLDYDPSLLLDDDELMQLINSVLPQTPQNLDVSTMFPASTENQTHDHNAIMISNSLHTSHPEAHPLQHNVVELNSASAPGKGEAGTKAGKKKSKAMEIERRRRQEMSSLYQELRSLLSADFKRKRSISDLLQEATNHINNLQVGIEGLNDKRDKLRMRQSAAGSSTNSSSSTVTVKPCKEGFIEVIFSTSALFEENNQSLRLSKVLRLLSKEGLNVVNCVSSRIDSNLVHTIQAQMYGQRSARSFGRMEDLFLMGELRFC